MFNRHCFGALLLAGLVLSINGCNSNTGLTTIVISPATVTVELAPPGYQQGHTQYTAIGYYGHAGHQSTQDITSQVTWSSSDSQVATISNAGLATATGWNSATGEGWVGNTSITAHMPGFNGDVVSNSATFTVTDCTSCANTDISSVTVYPATQTVATLGVPVQYVAVGKTVSGGTIPLTGLAGMQWTSSVPSVAAMSTTTLGLATTTGAGSTTITATFTNADGSGASGSATLTVAPSGSPEPLTAMTVTPTAQTSLAVGQTIQFIAIATTSSGSVNLTNQSATVNGQTIKAATWTSSNQSVASIDPATGIAKSLASGVSVITAMATNPDGTVVSGTSTYTVTVTSGSSTEPLVSLAILPTAQTSLATGTAANVNFIAIGTTSSGATVNLTSTPYTVPGSSPAQAVSVAQWSSSNPSVASFASATGGVATPNANGATAITAIVTNPDGTVVTGSAAYTVNVPSSTEPYVSLAIVPATQTLTSVGQQAKFIAIGTTGTGTTVDLTSQAYWSSSDANGSIVSQAGNTTPAVAMLGGNVFSAVANGAVAVTATFKNSTANQNAKDLTSVTASGSVSVNISATPEPLLSMSILPGSQSVAAGQPTQFLAMGNFSSSTPGPGAGAHQLPVTSAATGNAYNYTVTWYSSNPAVATVCASPGPCTTTQGAVTGSPVVVTGFTQGTTVITAIASGNPDGSLVTAAATFTVTGPAPGAITSITISPASQTITMAETGATTVELVVIGTNAAGLQTALTPTSWSSSNPGVVPTTNCPTAGTGCNIVSGTGTAAGTAVATAIGPGSTTITANYTNACTAPCTPILATGSATLTVSGPAPEPLLSLAITPNSPSAPYPSQTVPTQLTAIGTFSTNPVTQNLTSTVTWSSSNTAVATVCTLGGNCPTTSSTPTTAQTAGLVYAVGNGTAAITATDTTTNPDSSLVYATVPFTVEAASAGQMSAISILPGSLSLSATGQAGYLTALGTSTTSGLQEDVTNSWQSSTQTGIIWTSSNPAIATVSTAPNTAGSNSTELGQTTQTCAYNNDTPPVYSCTTDAPGVVKGVSVGSATITAEYVNQPATGTTPAVVVTNTASVNVTATPAAEPLLSITVLPSTITDYDLLGTAQYLAYGTFSTDPTEMDITNGFFHAGFASSGYPDSSCTSSYAALDAAYVAAQTALDQQVTDLPQPQCAFVPITWISTSPFSFPVDSAGSAGSTGGLSTADGNGNTNIYAEAANPDGTLVYSPLVTFNCPYAPPTWTTDAAGDLIAMTNPGTCNPETISDSLLTTLTVFNTGLNTTNWLITASSATGTADVIHCGPGWAGGGGTVCTATYPNGSAPYSLTLTATQNPADSGPQNTFGGWSNNCVSISPNPSSKTGPNTCTVQIGTNCTLLSAKLNTYVCTLSNISIGAIFN